MFGSKNDKQSNVANPSVSNNVTNSIVDGTSIKEISMPTTTSELMEYWWAIWTVQEGLLLDTRKVEGNITCANAIIEGNFKENYP